MSAAGVGRPWIRSVFPVATPTEDWRQNVGLTYAGISLGAAVPVTGTPGDNIVMAVLPLHEVSRPISIAFEWKRAIKIGGVDDEDNAGADITNPDTQLNGDTRNTLKIGKKGSFLTFRMVYDDGLSSITNPVIQAFGRFGKVTDPITGLEIDEPWQRLKTLESSPSVDVTITTAAADLTDGTNDFTDPDFLSETVDLNGTDEVTLRVKTALAGTGDTTTAYLEAKLVSGIRTF